MNLLDGALLSTNLGRHSLPGLLAAMAAGRVHRYSALRPHQRPALHMFLVQLGALAMDRAGQTELPDREEPWRAALLGLTKGDAHPWALSGPQDRAAFLQPAVLEGSKALAGWNRVETPDGLDMLITSRNHDLKQAVARQADPELWVYSLISLQTMEGYGGAGNHGIIRMNGGSASRPMLGFAPALPDGSGPDPSAWWWRDVTRLLALRRTGEAPVRGTAGGPALLWTLPWPEERQLALSDLDPWFIEICRRVRLVREGERLIALRTTSAKARINSDGVNGVTDDPWCPVTTKAPQKSLTLSSGDFDYKLMQKLLFANPRDWDIPVLVKPAEREAAGLIVAEAFSRGNSKTEGFKSRILPVPGWARGFLTRPDAGTLAREQIAEIEVFDAALRNGLARLAARGTTDKPDKAHYDRSKEARARFERAADALFFPALWDRLGAAPDQRATVMEAFVGRLFAEAQAIFDASLPTIPCPSILRPRAEARARASFRFTVWRGHGGGRDFAFLFPAKESVDAEG